MMGSGRCAKRERRTEGPRCFLVTVSRVGEATEQKLRFRFTRVLCDQNPAQLCRLFPVTQRPELPGALKGGTGIEIPLRGFHRSRIVRVSWRRRVRPDVIVHRGLLVDFFKKDRRRNHFLDSAGVALLTAGGQDGIVVLLHRNIFANLTKAKRNKLSKLKPRR